MPGAGLFAIGLRTPKFAVLLFGFFMSGLIYVWAYAIFHLHEIISIFLAILFLIVYLYLFYKLVYLKEKKEKDKKYIACKYCGREFDMSDSLMCPHCFKTNAY
jgi:prepilin signal peptidase PulO-like enzyme (type II secretory pathway)